MGGPFWASIRRYRIRWDDGHETLYSPAAGPLRHGPVKAKTRT